MKKAIVAICLMLCYFIVPAGQTATMDDLVGTWQVNESETLVVAGLGTDQDGGPGTCTFSADGTFSSASSSDPSDVRYSGEFSLDAKGKKLNWNLDADGVAELKDVLEEWIFDWASSEIEGVGLVTVVFQSIVCKVIKIDKKTNKPISALLKIKGTASAVVQGEIMTKKIKYTSLVSYSSGPTRP